MNKELTLQELHPLILEWANNKGFLKKENAPKQYLKLLAEIGETAEAILQNDVPKIKDGIGDVFVVLVIFAEQLSFRFDSDLDLHKKMRNHKKEIGFHFSGIINSAYGAIHNEIFGKEMFLAGLNEISEVLNLDLTECANLAWKEIKDRTGRTVDGTFIKD